MFYVYVLVTELSVWWSWLRGNIRLQNYLVTYQAGHWKLLTYIFNVCIFGAIIQPKLFSFAVTAHFLWFHFQQLLLRHLQIWVSIKLVCFRVLWHFWWLYNKSKDSLYYCNCHPTPFSVYIKWMSHVSAKCTWLVVFYHLSVLIDISDVLCSISLFF